MATMLARLGRFAFKRRGPVVLAWLAILAGALFAGLTAPAVPDDDFSVPGVESQRAFELMQERFPGLTADAGGATTPPPGPTAAPLSAIPGIRDLTNREREAMKLGARDRAQLVVMAYKNGLVPPEPGNN